MNSEPISSLGIYLSDLPTVKVWAKVYDMSMPDMIRAWILAVKEHKQREMYSRLPMPSDYKKPLAGRKIDKRNLNYKFAELVDNKKVVR